MRRERWSPSATSTAIDPMLPATIPHGAERPPRARRLKLPHLPGRDRETKVSKRTMWLGVSALFFGAIAIITGSTLRIGDSGTDSAADLTRAFELQSAGELDEAASLYRDVIIDDPDSVVALFNLGVIENTQGDTELAASHYERAIAVDGTHAPAMFNLAVIRGDQGRVDEAVGLYRSLLAIEPEDANALMNLGILLLQSGENVEASGLIERAIQLDPTLGAAAG